MSKTIFRNSFSVIMVFAFLLLISNQVSAIPGYNITKLWQGQATGINESGQVVGYYWATESNVHAILWDNGVTRDLGTLGYPESSARDLDESGLVVGGLTGGHGFTWSNGEMKPLPIEAWEINSGGQIVGSSHFGHEVSEVPALWENGEVIDLGYFDQNYRKGSAWAINEASQVVGYVENSSDLNDRRAFLWENGTMYDLQTPDSVYSSRAWDINDKGQIVGNNNGKPTLWDDKGANDLGGNGTPRAINNLGQIVGESQDNKPVLWENGTTVNLFDLIDPNLGWKNKGIATDLNDRGQIVGFGLFEDQENYAFLLTPIPVDSDGDGIPDDEDACPNSDLSGTVVIDGCDSGVENVLLDDGCTISDLISQCADDAENHGEFVSGVSHMTNYLKKNGTISGKEKGKIQKCAAKADNS